MSSNNKESSNQFDPQAWITLSQAAQHTDISSEGLRKACQKGKLAGIKRGGRWWVTNELVAEYVDNNKRGRPLKSTSEVDIDKMSR